jgi:hypothetical protein
VAKPVVQPPSAPPSASEFEAVAARLADALELPPDQRLAAIGRLKPGMAKLSAEERERLTSRALDYLQGRKAYSGTSSCSRLYGAI